MSTATGGSAPCTCGTDATSLKPAEVVVHQAEGSCYIAPAGGEG